MRTLFPYVFLTHNRRSGALSDDERDDETVDDENEDESESDDGRRAPSKGRGGKRNKGSTRGMSYLLQVTILTRSQHGKKMLLIKTTRIIRRVRRGVTTLSITVSRVPLLIASYPA